jgi:hypothetical protein
MFAAEENGKILCYFGTGKKKKEDRIPDKKVVFFAPASSCLKLQVTGNKHFEFFF